MSALPGPVSPGGQRAVRSDPRQVGDAADIDDDHRPGEPGALHQRPMIDRHQRRTLTAGRDVGRAQVEHHRHAEALRQRSTVADLHRQPTLGCVENRLTVESDEVDRQARVLAAQLLDDRAMGRRHDPLRIGDHPRPGVPVRERPGPGHRAPQDRALSVRVRTEHPRSEAGDRLAVGFEHGGVDAVHRGAAHQAKDVHEAPAIHRFRG